MWLQIIQIFKNIQHILNNIVVPKQNSCLFYFANSYLSMKKTKHSSSMKAKNTAHIHHLEDQLFSKLQTIDSAVSKYDDLEFRMINDTPDALSDLIGRARGITSQNQDKILKAKKQIRVSRKEAAGTFLTGTGIYTAEVEEEVQLPMVQPEEEVDVDSMLKELIHKNEHDDLAELRRMIKLTDQELDVYEKDINRIKKKTESAQLQFGHTSAYKPSRGEGSSTRKLTHKATRNRYL